ncbi:DUF2157 domain-containing protein [Flagellimonas zhangzhouensis]|uniref:Predicted membrane protein n=1 Tax=Flagellimonas zhangzhouensis TaxID=1073328 RepID=A0A1H2U5V9_9FLAO|nr:DUF2157 domain-containing protein [Allomuricauda zhangzhouensis]SDQ20007.1 Predicted membrane protein [Allomuricauda zhangzhouensis]SDW51481.1 Predicted membrane protein [Allomuricauda zhangzhouensis]
MSLLKDLPELEKAGVITSETAVKIEAYYKSQHGSSTNKLFVVFGILGAILVGLGIILIIAHNWDELSKITKTFFAFLPLLVGQFFCAFALFKKKESVAWRESTSAFLFFAFGSSISLVSQVYNIPGNLSSFLLTWMLLCLPLFYVMKSSITSLLYLIGITYYACETSYWNFPTSTSYAYWALLLLALPYYYHLLKNKTKSNFTSFHNWVVPLSVIIVLGTITDKFEELMFVAYISLFGLVYLVGESKFFASQLSFRNGYRILGSLGTIICLLILSFDDFWGHLRQKDFLFDELARSPELIVSVLIAIIAGVMFFFHFKERGIKQLKPIAPVFLFFIPLFILGIYTPYPIFLVNILIFLIAIQTIRVGAHHNHLGILNYGLLTIAILIVCRFFDSNLSYVLRGILFVIVGAGFFFANYWMLKKRKEHG